MKKRAIALFLSLLLLGSFAMSAFAADEGDTRVTLGADLNADEIAAVYKIFGVDRGQVEELVVTNADERAYLEGLVSDAAIDAYKQLLFPLSTLITPNRREAEVLLGHAISDVESDLRELSRWGCSVLVKSVEQGKYLVDYLYEVATDTVTPFPKKRLVLTDRNGTGDTLASAIATHLALGCDLQTALSRAEAYMHFFLANPRYVISVGEHGK